MTARHYLDVTDLDGDELHALLDRADALKADRRSGGGADVLGGRSVGMIFEKPSTRTRVSFEVGITELGGHAVVLNAGELQLGRGETVDDTARVLSGYLSAVVVRTFAHSRLETLASAGSIPVVNALSDASHPCQALADLQTIRARTGGLEGRTLAYLGDGNNVAHSLVEAGAMTGMSVVVGTPEGFEPDPERIERARAIAAGTGAEITVTNDPAAAAKGADVLYTDVWASMGQEAEHEARLAAFEGFQLSADLVAGAAPDAVVLHCLPAHRGEEIAGEVIDGPQSAVWEQAENRLHAQKALLELLLGGAGDGG